MNTTEKQKLKKNDHPTGENMGINVKGVVDRVDRSPPVVSLAEGECGSISTNVKYICILSQ